MRIALAQINPKLGDFKSNGDKIISFASRAHEKRADVVVFSELSLFGYPPYDFLEHRALVKNQLKELTRVVKSLPQGLTAIFGAVILNDRAKKGGKPFINAAVVAQKGKKPQIFGKQLLPAYDVFDDGRFFEPGVETGIISLPKKKGKVAVTVCEDMWGCMKEWGNPIYSHDPLALREKVNLVVNISASPFYQDKLEVRRQAAKAHVKRTKAPFVYVNQVGGQDELIFDGRSFILDQKGKLLVEAAAFQEDLVIIDLATHQHEYRPQETDEIEILRQALVVGIRDFIGKVGLKKAHVGLSGGIDSALVAALAVDALGPGNVTGLLLPGPYSSQGSVDDALALAANLGIKAHKVNITPLYEKARDAIGEFSASGEGSIVNQNIQARLRGLVLMSYANETGGMLLATSNKAELATGYSTLYGDMDGGLMPIGDLVKGEVYELAKLYNREREIIPTNSLKKAPSAELAPGQVDQDTLPPYSQLDKAVKKIVEKRDDPSSSVEKWLWQALGRSEFKRWQAAPILKVSKHAFGRGRRVPLAVRF